MYMLIYIITKTRSSLIMNISTLLVMYNRTSSEKKHLVNKQTVFLLYIFRKKKKKKIFNKFKPLDLNLINTYIQLCIIRRIVKNQVIH